MLERFVLAGAIALSLSWFAQLNPHSQIRPVGELPAPKAHLEMAVNHPSQ